MKILIVNSHLETGGISQSLLNLLSNIKDLNINIDLQLLKYDENIINKFEQLKYVNICPQIRILNVFMTSFSKQRNLLDRVLKTFFWGLSKIIGKKRTLDVIMKFAKESKEYDIAISYSNDIWASHVNGFFGGCNDYVLKKVKAKKKIAWIHNEPPKLGLTYELCKGTYEKFDYIINVSFACKNMFDAIIPEYKHKSKVVYNMFDIERIRALSNEENPYKEDVTHIVTVARLDNQQKRIDKIIKCCKRLKEEGITNFQWHIVGDGPDMGLLQELSRKKGTNDVAIFEGRKENPYPYMKYADIFVLTSDYEAFPMVVRESIITGTPVISTNYPSAYEVVNNYGLVVENDEKSIYEAVKKIIQTPQFVNRMKEHINSNKMSNETALKQFKEVLSDL